MRFAIPSHRMNKTTGFSGEEADESLETSSCSSPSVEDFELSQTFFFGAELTGQSPEFVWRNFQESRKTKTGAEGGRSSAVEEDEEQDKEEDEDDEDEEEFRQTIQLRQVSLGKGAKNNERNLVQLTAKTGQGEDESYVIASLITGKQETASLNHDFCNNTPIVLSLIEGSGPVAITGNLIKEFLDKDYDYNKSLMNATEEEYEEESEDVDEDEAEEVEEEEVEIQKPIKSKMQLHREGTRAIRSKANGVTEAKGAERMEEEQDNKENRREKEESESEGEKQERRVESVKEKQLTKFKLISSSSSSSSKRTPKRKLKETPKQASASKKMK